jgi:uncharacterized protein YqhQ
MKNRKEIIKRTEISLSKKTLVMSSIVLFLISHILMSKTSPRTLKKLQANLLETIAGRGVLINAVLSAKPIYFMLLFLLSKWIIKMIDNIRRRFVWHGHKIDDKKSMCLVSWNIVTM